MKKRNVKNALAAFFSATLVVLAAFALVSCDNELDVQQEYPFTVETMPVPTRIVKGETVEVRCKLKREGRFSDARYTIRYFQQTIDIYFEDNSEPAQLFQLSFSFNNERTDETEENTEGTVVSPERPWLRDSLVIRPPVLKSEKGSICE